jgi:hypothetical protein
MCTAASAPGVPRPSLGDYVAGWGPRGGRAAPEGVHVDYAHVLWHRSAAARLLDVTLHDRPALLTIYRVDPVPQFTRVPFALPRVVSDRGAGATVAPRLNNVERKSLQQSASLVRKAIGPLQHVRGFA